MKSGIMIGSTLISLAAVSAGAQPMKSAAEWCAESGERRDGARSCDVREYTLSGSSVSVDAGKNGGVRIAGGARSDTLVRARVVATAPTQAEADAIAKQVRVTTDGGKVSATGPDTLGDRLGWYVSYEVWTPTRTNVSARTTNGGISIADVSGTVAFKAVNGGVRLSKLAGDVKGETVNGGVTVELAGDHWEGAGLDARTTNGGVKVSVPDGYSCQLAVATVNGGVRADFPITVQGRLDRQLDVPLGTGGAPVRISTTNGGIRLLR